MVSGQEEDFRPFSGQRKCSTMKLCQSFALRVRSRRIVTKRVTNSRSGKKNMRVCVRPISLAVLVQWNQEGFPECFHVPWTSTYGIYASSVTVTPRHMRSYWKKNLRAMDIMWKKVECVGHVQKWMGTALCELKKQYRGQKLSDGKPLEVLDDSPNR